ncbi:hypothetical protein [Legionella shakespearei]|uniref:Uncharacterized protein n=1 Tax=Legionella shakespearei DSM 23087 TaxID=1122169 RepID=A0A0W0YHW4_9GAMM|nr:hypothetical protein [Legionella shakespearei]KTD56423.1 hypothetical protein Lsha_2822 [Legionella shakespearei DSM 23087]
MSAGKDFDSRLFAKKYVNEGRRPVSSNGQHQPLPVIKEEPEEREEDVTPQVKTTR